MDEIYFDIRGVVEGFYGTFYTPPQRNDLIRFLGAHGSNFYLYGPKNDRQHRMRWREPYPPPVLDAFAETIAVAQESGVQFCYAISFGVPLTLVSDEELGLITAKLHLFYERGCRSFAVFLDDLPTDFSLAVEGSDFQSRADADADCCNRLYAWARSLDDSCSLLVCPTHYHGRPPFPRYLYELGELLFPEIEVLYTGPEVCSGTITRADAERFAEAVGRPPVIWDNYPVNDGDMRSELHVGPLRGRDPALHTACRGFLSNPMNQAEASKIPLLTVAEYLRDPYAYDPASAWERALSSMAGADGYGALRAFSENSLHSCLEQVQAPSMDGLVGMALAALQCGESPSRSQAVTRLSAYLDRLDDSIYSLRNRMPNLALRQDLLPWIEALDEKVWMGRSILRVLKTIESGGNLGPALRVMDDLVSGVRRTRQEIGGAALFALAELARKRAHEASRSSPGARVADPPDGGLFAVLDQPTLGEAVGGSSTG